jgi:hypothetical protein
MKKRETLTAAEFAAQLANDSEYQAKVAAQKEHAAVIEAEAKPILADLAAVGVNIGSIDELRRSYAALPRPVVDVLLRWLGQLSNPALQEAIVRDLAGVQEPFDVHPLLTLFEQTASQSVRWAIANTLAELRPLDAREWVIGALDRAEFGRAREMLPLALARIAPSGVANAVLVKHLDDMPAHVAIGLAESGGPAEAELLRRKANSEKGWIRKELTRAIRKIERRFKA